jgi:cytochrome P450 family 110
MLPEMPRATASFAVVPDAAALAPWDARLWGGLPAGPPLTPDEQTFRWLARPYDFLRECHAALGDTFTLSIKGWPAPHVVMCDPAAIKQVMLGSANVFYAGRGNALLRPILGPSSLLTLDRAEHIRQRRMLLSAFRAERMRAYSALTRDLTRRAVAQWPRGKAVGVQDLMLDLSLDVILFAIFGMGDDSAAMSALKPRMAEFLRLISTGLSPQQAGVSDAPSPAQLRLQQLQTETDALLLEAIERRRMRPDKTRVDMLELLSEGTDETGRALTSMELRDQLMTLTLAGHETTAGSLTWALLLLDENPDAAARLYDELATISPRFDPDEVSTLPYLGAVCLETLRLRPAVPATSRWLARPTQVLDMDLPGGIFVLPCIYLVHRRSGSFPDPEGFQPERFIDHEYSPYEYMPFGGGVRRCIGMSFAMHEMKMILAVVLTSLRARSAARLPVRGVRRGVVVGPTENGRMILEPVDGARSPISLPGIQEQTNARQ